MNLTAENVSKTFLYCMFTDEENPDGKENGTIGECIMLKCAFHSERLKESEPFIIEMLDDLHHNFKRSGGGGWSFLYMCNDKNGNQWADLHQTVDELVCLGNAIGKLSFLMPREYWGMFTGSMPYIVID